MNQLMSQADYARYRGVGRPAVSNWKKAGHLVLAEDLAGRLLIDVARTDARLNARIDPMRGRPSTAEAAPPIDSPPPLVAGLIEQSAMSVERLELIREQRAGQALKNAKAARELVPLAEGMTILVGASRMLRERMQSELRVLAERLANETETRTVMKLIEDTVDRVFAEVAAEIEAGDDDDDFDDDGDGDAVTSE